MPRKARRSTRHFLTLEAMKWFWTSIFEMEHLYSAFCERGRVGEMAIGTASITWDDLAWRKEGCRRSLVTRI